MSSHADPEPDPATPVLAEVRTHSIAPLQVGSRVGSWQVLRVLGEGATGIVYEVAHLKLGTRRALKVLTWAHPTLQARLLTEGRAQAAIVHPNVVSVIDLITIGNVPALLMELVDGPSLEGWLKDNRPDPAQVEELFRGILAAVATAHAAGLVHRDLKPANVLMARIRDRWVPKVTDFGLAKDTASGLGLTDSGITMGTPGYMAPEQIRSPRDVDERADIFALGCILYQLLSGAAPHQGGDALTVMNAVSGGVVTRLERCVPGLERRMYRTVRAAMAVDPEDRPKTCQALLAILEGEAPPVRRGRRGAPRWASLLALSIALPLTGSLVVLGPLAVETLRAEGSEPVAEERASIVPPRTVDRAPRPVFDEPWVPDDVDVNLVAPPPVPSTGPVARVAPVPEEAVVGLGCAGGWALLPRWVKAPDLGPWEARRELEIHDGVPNAPGPIMCTLDRGRIVDVMGPVVKGDGGRWVPVRVLSAP